MYKSCVGDQAEGWESQELTAPLSIGRTEYYTPDDGTLYPENCQL